MHNGEQFDVPDNDIGTETLLIIYVDLNCVKFYPLNSIMHHDGHVTKLSTFS